MNSLKAKLDALLARKLVAAFIVGYVAAFADSIVGIAQSQQPLSTSLLVGAAVGALAAAARAVLALSPLNVVASDSSHSLVGAQPAARQLSVQVPIVVRPRVPSGIIHVTPLPEQTAGVIRRLGRHVEHDERSRAYPATDTAPPATAVLWVRHGKPFNQGQLGSCTGNATAGLLNTDPFRAARKGRLLTEKDAVTIYELATTLDSIAGEYPPTDTGSSGLAVCKAAKQLGYISGYKHAFSLAAALAALKTGPVITGVPWYEGFDTPDANGVVEISGQVRGGHEFEILGYDPATDLVTAENSWGSSYGIVGRFFFTSKTWGELLARQGDVTVPIPLGGAS